MFLMSDESVTFSTGLVGLRCQKLTPALPVLSPSSDLDEFDIVVRFKAVFESWLFQLALEVVDVHEDLGADDFSEHVQTQSEPVERGL